jgi:hypothetical protein
MENMNQKSKLLWRTLTTTYIIPLSIPPLVYMSFTPLKDRDAGPFCILAEVHQFAIHRHSLVPRIFALNTNGTLALALLNFGSLNNVYHHFVHIIQALDIKADVSTSVASGVHKTTTTTTS